MILGSTPYLTRREIEVLAALAQGLERGDVGQLLGIAPITVRNHCRHIYRRLGARNAASAVYLAMQAGLIEREEEVMPGKDRLKEIVKESVERARLMGANIDVAANHPGGATVDSVTDCAQHAHEAIDTAAEAARILVREGA